MKRCLLATVLISIILGGCASGRTQPALDPNMDPARWGGDARLYRILLGYPITDAQQDSIRVYASEHGAAANYLLAEAAEDVNAPEVVRVNALFLLAQRRADTHMFVFRNAIVSENPRVRTMAVAAMREMLPGRPREAISIARMALADPDADVQAQALQILGDGDIDLLREYIPRAASDELRIIAEDLVQLAEQRGAPLEGDSTTGALLRETSDGFVIAFTPERYWPQWNAGFGSVSISKDGATIQTIDGIESVAGVLPVFLSPDARHVVFERDRTIIVRSMADGSERIVGAGVAPRPRPFTEQFVFLREQADGTSEKREVTEVVYDVFAAPFDPPGDFDLQLIGSTTATLTFGRNGNYSPVRWMRVEERMGSFYLTSSDMEIVTLPDPFG